MYVNASSGDARIGLNAVAGSDTEIKFSNAGTVQYTIGHDDGTDNFVIGTANVDTPKVSITKNGNVGIGTASPATNLEVGTLQEIQQLGFLQMGTLLTSRKYNSLGILVITAQLDMNRVEEIIQEYI